MSNTTLDPKPKRLKVDPAASHPDTTRTRKMDKAAVPESQHEEGKPKSSPPRNEDTTMTENNDDEENEEYARMTKEIVETFVVGKNLAHASKQVGVPDEMEGEAKETALRQGILEALLFAFNAEQSSVRARGDDAETTNDLAEASLNFLKEQQKLLKIENEMRLLLFLHGLCVNVLREYNEGKARQDKSHKRRKQNDDTSDTSDQVVNLFRNSLKGHERSK